MIEKNPEEIKTQTGIIFLGKNRSFVSTARAMRSLEVSFVECAWTLGRVTSAHN